jgi:Tol biopolymer transport system component
VTNNSWRQRGSEFSPNGRWLAYTSDESKEEEIWLFDRQTGAKKKLTTHASFKSIDGWAPDSSRLVWTGDNRMFVTTAESGQTVELAHNVAGGYNVTGWSPDGKVAGHHQARRRPERRRRAVRGGHEARSERDAEPVVGNAGHDHADGTKVCSSRIATTA